jgi:hypothetical protein
MINLSAIDRLMIACLALQEEIRKCNEAVNKALAELNQPSQKEKHG